MSEFLNVSLPSGAIHVVILYIAVSTLVAAGAVTSSHSLMRRDEVITGIAIAHFFNSLAAPWIVSEALRLWS